MLFSKKMYICFSICIDDNGLLATPVSGFKGETTPPGNSEFTGFGFQGSGLRFGWHPVSGHMLMFWLLPI